MKLTVSSIVLSALLFPVSTSAFLAPANGNVRTFGVSSSKTTNLYQSSKSQERTTAKKNIGKTGINVEPEAATKRDSKDVSLKKYKIRSTILQHALQTKQKEASLLRDKLTILQDVIQKLQSSNKNLLARVQELKSEKNSIFANNITAEAGEAKEKELWPPEMEVKLMKEEFNSKEIEYENALTVAQSKYSDVKERCNDLLADIEERDADIRFYQERSMVDESEMNYLREEIEKFQAEINEAATAKASEMADQIEKDGDNGKMTAEEDWQLKELKALIVALEEQNKIARDQFKELNEQWKGRREEMQEIIASTQNKVLSLETDLEQSQLERSQVQTMLEQTQLELEESRDIIQTLKKDAVSPPTATGLDKLTAEEQAKAKQFSKESLEIATASVRQAEERALELKKKYNKLEKNYEDSIFQNDMLVEKVLELELQLDQYEKAGANEDVLKREQELLKRIDGLEKELEVAQARFEQVPAGEDITDDKESGAVVDAMWKEKISVQKKEYEELIQDLKDEVGRLVKAKTAASLSIPPSEAKSRQSRLRRVINRVRSLLPGGGKNDTATSTAVIESTKGKTSDNEESLPVGAGQALSSSKDATNE
mmetsp:Transcript_29376/g.44830  ORF Transcript_29376/g.44830 Transcript_29376/m.44830 type:complete len:601 (+) Transcript_29376:100-1902(+)